MASDASDGLGDGEGEPGLRLIRVARVVLLGPVAWAIAALFIELTDALEFNREESVAIAERLAWALRLHGAPIGWIIVAMLAVALPSIGGWLATFGLMAVGAAKALWTFGSIGVARI